MVTYYLYIFTFYIFSYNCIISSHSLAIVAQGHKGVTKTRGLWIRSPLEGMNYYFLMFLFIRSGSKAKARRWVPPLNTQFSKYSAESGQWSVLSLCSLCLPCCVRHSVKLHKNAAKTMYSYKMFVSFDYVDLEVWLCSKGRRLYIYGRKDVHRSV